MEEDTWMDLPSYYDETPVDEMLANWPDLPDYRVIPTVSKRKAPKKYKGIFNNVDMWVCLGYKCCQM